MTVVKVTVVQQVYRETASYTIVSVGSWTSADSSFRLEEEIFLSCSSPSVLLNNLEEEILLILS